MRRISHLFSKRIVTTCCSVLAALSFTFPGIADDRFDTLTGQLDALVTEGVMPGSITYIVEDGKVVYQHMNGYQDLKHQSPIAKDTLFRLYSMSKPITSVAIMRLQEAGQLSVDDPVEKFIPAFRDANVYVSGTLDNMVTEPLQRSMTIGDLLAHKSGITYHFTGTTAVHEYYRKYGVKRDTPVGSLPTDGAPAKNLAQLTERLAKAPLLHQPGERFTYSYSTTLLGRIIELVSGKSLDAYLQEEIFTPLGMHDTMFFVTGKDLDRFITNYVMTDTGLKEIENRDNTDYKDLNRLLDGGGALASTADDYLAFATMLANKGRYNGKVFLSEASIDTLFTPQITIDEWGQDSVMEFGYGFAIGSAANLKANAMPDNTYGWAGSGNTIFWVNPDTQSLVVFMTQVITPPPFNTEVPFRQYLIQATTGS
ncbi:MAG: beta-lactamase family protein [Alteromonadaceae bacterium]|nr:beta-lactamase family protein [Alteromonadaceae bacterium]